MEHTLPLPLAEPVCLNVAWQKQAGGSRGEGKEESGVLSLSLCVHLILAEWGRRQQRQSNIVLISSRRGVIRTGSLLLFSPAPRLHFACGRR